MKYDGDPKASYYESVLSQCRTDLSYLVQVTGNSQIVQAGPGYLDTAILHFFIPLV